MIRLHHLWMRCLRLPSVVKSWASPFLNSQIKRILSMLIMNLIKRIFSQYRYCLFYTLLFIIFILLSSPSCSLARAAVTGSSKPDMKTRTVFESKRVAKFDWLIQCLALKSSLSFDGLTDWVQHPTKGCSPVNVWEFIASCPSIRLEV